MKDFDDDRFDDDDREAMTQAALRGLVMGLLIVLALMMASCSTTAVGEPKIESMEGRFNVEYLYGDMTVITDTDEGCQYLFYKCGYGGGFIQLTDKYGNPLLAEGYSRREVGMSNDDGE